MTIDPNLRNIPVNELGGALLGTRFDFNEIASQQMANNPFAAAAEKQELSNKAEFIEACKSARSIRLPNSHFALLIGETVIELLPALPPYAAAYPDKIADYLVEAMKA